MRETLTCQETLEEILALKKGQSVFLPCPEEASARMWMANLEQTALGNLVASYVQQFGKPKDNLRFDDIYARLLKTEAEYTGTIHQIIQKVLGEDLALFLTAPGNGYRIRYDSRVDAICITKQCPPVSMRGGDTKFLPVEKEE